MRILLNRGKISVGLMALVVAGLFQFFILSVNASQSVAVLDNCSSCVHYNAQATSATPVVFANATVTYGQNLIIKGFTLTNAGAVTTTVTLRAATTPIFGPQSFAPNTGAVVNYPLPVPTNAGSIDMILNGVQTPGVYGDVVLQPKSN